MTIPGIGTFPDAFISIGRANGKTAPQPLDIQALARDTFSSLTAAGFFLGSVRLLASGMEAMTNQDDDAHEPCSLTACRNPLHPGPCKGWKHTLHAVSPGAYHQLEAERVRKANERRLKRIADLKAQNKPIPRRLLEEIKPKPAPVAAVPLSQVGQKADLAGGRAHAAGQAVSHAAGITPTPKVALPLGPKQKKPTVAGRGPAFVITQPKVTDQYKLDKAAKITPQEWAGLSDADKTAIRNELTAIKARGFGPQQTKADELLSKLPPPTAAKPATAPGRVSLGQAVKTMPATVPHHTGPTPAPAPTKLSQIATPKTAITTGSKGAPAVLPQHAQMARAVAGRGVPRANLAKTQLDAYGKLTKDDFDNLDSATQRTIRDDLANAKAKFLDPKKQQQAQDLLDRFGSRHTPTPATPSRAKPYSDPMTQAVKAAHGSNTDEMFKRVGALTPDQVKQLDDADRKTILGRLAFIATHPQATDEQKSRAIAFGRIINKGSPAQTSRKWDHEPSIGELHAEETKTGIARTRATDALKAARDNRMPVSSRAGALTGLSKDEFDSLKPDEQREIVKGLHDVHGNLSDLQQAKQVRDAATRYTGQHLAVAHLQRAEEDFRAGKATAENVVNAHVSARILARSHGDQAVQDAVASEARRIAVDNPTLPTYARASLAGDASYTKSPTAVGAIQLAQIKSNWDDAPRMSHGDLQELFRADKADLANADPIHAQAVRDLQEHVLSTGLAPNSPWSTATRNSAVNHLLNIDSGGAVPQDRLDRFEALPPRVRDQVRSVLSERLAAQTSPHAKTDTWVALRALKGDRPLSPATLDAVLEATDPYPTTQKLDSYRKLDPDEFRKLPDFTRQAITADLVELQRRLATGAPTLTLTPSDDTLRAFPAAMAAHLLGTRNVYATPAAQRASDVANYGSKIINPYDRTRTYANLGPTRFAHLTTGDQNEIKADLDRISHDSANSLAVRYNAQYTKDAGIVDPTMDVQQLVAVERADPMPNAGYGDADVVAALKNLDKSGFDSLDKTYQEAIDARIARLPGPQQQAMVAKFHPGTAPATPAGFTPTVQANVQPHVQAALDTIYGVHPKSHTMAHQLSTYGALRGNDFGQLNAQEQNHLLSDLSFIATTAKGPSADKAKKLIDRFTPAGTPAGQVPTPPIIPPANSVPGQIRFGTPQKGTLHIAADKGLPGDGWTTTPGGKRVWGKYGAAGLLLMHQDPATGERRYLMVQRGPAISDPGKWQFPGGAIDSKETFHQGGAREVIEELGFKADALKDAEVHGEHHNEIPGSNWKYVSVAAQVPAMLKPDLSTHHARAETSDAKWMTEAEIRKLDTDGKLLAPLAGGKLEQNVLSLFPKQGQTLGQVVRPGPVTKRQGRLAVPPGGRQAPAQFNAWPHAHKPSKGKTLVADKPAIDKLRQDVKKARTAYDGKTADGRLAAIGAMQGFDDTPTVVSKSEMDRLLATGDYIEAWRGVRGTHGKSSAAINEEFRSGPAYYGKGIFGNGYYLATQKDVARKYADTSKNSIVRILIPKSAITAQYADMQREARANSSRRSQVKGGSYEDGTLYDPGRWAAAKGVDGIEIKHDTTNDTGGWARHVAAPGKPAFNWLNRSVLIVQEADK